MISVNFFVTFFSNVFYPYLRYGLMVRVDIIFIDHETQNIKNVHDDDEFYPFFVWL